MFWLEVPWCFCYSLILAFRLVQVECIDQHQANVALKEVLVQSFLYYLTYKDQSLNRTKSFIYKD